MIGPDDPVRFALAPWLAPAPPGGVLLAVSGGPDSTALMHAAASFRDTVTIHVATVDHGLRAGAAAEAAAVAHAANGLGLPHAILAWTGRKARDRLAGCGAAGALRTARRPCRDARGRARAHRAYPATIRPRRCCCGLPPAAASRGSPVCVRNGRSCRASASHGRSLPCPRPRLVDWCASRGCRVCRRSCQCRSALRPRTLRAAWPALEQEGLTSTRLVRLAERAARDEAALQALAERALDAASLPGAGAIRLDGTALTTLPEAVALRCLDRALERPALPHAAWSAWRLSCSVRCCRVCDGARWSGAPSPGSWLQPMPPESSASRPPRRVDPWRGVPTSPQGPPRYLARGRPLLTLGRRARMDPRRRAMSPSGAARARDRSMNPNFRNFALWVVIFLLVLALVTLFQNPGHRGGRQRDCLQPSAQRRGRRQDPVRRDLRTGRVRHLCRRRQLHVVCAE